MYASVSSVFVSIHVCTTYFSKRLFLFSSFHYMQIMEKNWDGGGGRGDQLREKEREREKKRYDRQNTLTDIQTEDRDP